MTISDRLWWCELLGEAWRPTAEYPAGLESICHDMGHGSKCGAVTLHWGNAMEWYCEIEDDRLAWASEAWPTFCPLCGKAVNRDLSTHHWIAEGENTMNSPTTEQIIHLALWEASQGNPVNANAVLDTLRHYGWAVTPSAEDSGRG